MSHLRSLGCLNEKNIKCSLAIDFETKILKCSPNEVTFTSRLETKNAPQLSERHFGEVPSGIEPL